MLVIFTDTDTDFTPKEAEEFGFKLISMPYIIDGKEIYPYEDFKEYDYKSYYDLLRSGVLPKTGAISPLKYKEYFEKEFKDGNDILYIHFSKAMSGTFNSMNIAVEELKKEYPDRKFYSLDTKAITILSYLILKEIGDLIKKGMTIDEIYQWAEKEVDKFTVYFYAEDLKFFQRSGRISNLSGFMGSLLGFKPIIHIGSDGIMKNIGKERGKDAVVKKLMSYVDELQENIKDYRVIVGHTDCFESASKLGNLLKEKYGDDLRIEYVIVNPTIASHCGPNCVGVAFHCIHR